MNWLFSGEKMFNLKFLTLQLVLHSLVIYFFIFHVDIGWFIILSMFITIFASSIIMHRYFAHKSFIVSPHVESIFAYISILSGMGSPISWASLHRKHHATSDSPTDPYNPKVHGITPVWSGVFKVDNIERKFFKGLTTKHLRKVHNNYFLFSYILMIALILIDPRVFVYLYGIPAIWSFHAIGMLGTLVHMFGYRNHDTKDDSKNNILVSILTLGEGWHNNHHAYPNRYKQGVKWWELDPPAKLIELLFLRKGNEIKK